MTNTEPPVSIMRQGEAFRALGVSIAIVVLADFLLWRGQFGISLVVGLVAIAAGVLVVNPPRHKNLGPIKALFLIPFMIAPLIEDVSLLSLAFGALGIATFALLATGQLRGVWPTVLGEPLKLLVVGPFRAIPDLVSTRDGSRPILGATTLSKWILPLTLSGVFLALFAAANPLIEKWLQVVEFEYLAKFTSPERVLFWLVVASFTWGIVAARAVDLPETPGTISAPQAQLAPMPQDPAMSAIAVMFGPDAILRALILFNILFGVQTTLDLAFLWRGAALPDGMSYATYAHRGAYPLIATTVLAALFVLATFGPERTLERSITARILVAAWLVQNVLLVLSSVLRLNLYVEVYSLSTWRIAAFIWMGLIAFGLLSILLRIILQRSNTWLFGANLAATLAVLYACCFFNFAAYIAHFNVTHSRELSGQGVKLDYAYLVSLGPEAIPAIDQIAEQQRSLYRHEWLAMKQRCGMAEEVAAKLSDWRGWTWRLSRLGAYMREKGAPAWC